MLPPLSFNWFVWFVLFVWLNETNQMDKTNQINQTDQASPLVVAISKRCAVLEWRLGVSG